MSGPQHVYVAEVVDTSENWPWQGRIRLGVRQTLQGALELHEGHAGVPLVALQRTSSEGGFDGSKVVPGAWRVHEDGEDVPGDQTQDGRWIFQEALA